MILSQTNRRCVVKKDREVERKKDDDHHRVIFNVIYSWLVRYIVTLSVFIITRQSIIHYSLNKTMNDSKIGSSIGEFVRTLENNKFIIDCVLHSFTLCTRSTGAIKNIQFLVVVTTSTSKKLTYHAMLRDNTYKLCCMNNEEKKKREERSKEKNVVVTLPWS